MMLQTKKQFAITKAKRQTTSKTKILDAELWQAPIGPISKSKLLGLGPQRGFMIAQLSDWTEKENHGLALCPHRYRSYNHDVMKLKFSQTDFNFPAQIAALTLVAALDHGETPKDSYEVSATLNGHDIGSNLKLGGIEHGGPQVGWDGISFVKPSTNCFRWASKAAVVARLRMLLYVEERSVGSSQNLLRQRDEFNNFKKFMFGMPKQSLEWLQSRGGHNNVDLTVRCPHPLVCLQMLMDDGVRLNFCLAFSDKLAVAGVVARSALWC